MPLEMDNFTQKLLDRTRARNEALQQKMQEHAFQGRKRRPLETQENIAECTGGAGSVTKKDEDYSSEKALATESPNKRSRLETENRSNSTTLSPAKPASIASKGGEKSVSERMQRLLNQRKQWEAAEHGEDVDFESVQSPMHQDHQSPVVTMPPQRKVDIERKARFAALAQELNNREDDMSHPTLLSASPELLQAKPPCPGRKTPMSEVYRSETVTKSESDEVISKEKESSRPVKSVSQRVSLSIETLAQFANKDKPSSSRTTFKVPTQSKLDRVTVASFLKASNEVESHQVTPASKTVQERLLELQKHGCKAEQSSGMEKIFSGREEELKRMRDDDSEEENTSGDTETLDAEETEDSVNLSENLEPDSSMVTTASEVEDKENSEVRSDEQDKPSTSIEKLESYVNPDESGLSFSDSMMEDLDTNQDPTQKNRVSTAIQCDLSFESDEESDLSALQKDLYSLSAVSGNDSYSNEADMQDSRASDQSDQEDIGADDQLIDDLFEGVTTIDDDVMETPHITDIANGKPTLTRQKSRQEIRSELTVRKQTCNEAEDTHVIRRNPSRHLRPLARSTSSESVVSLGSEKPSQEQNVPVFTIQNYRKEKRKSIRNVDKKIVRNEDVKPVVKMRNIKRNRGSSLKEKNSVLMDEVQQQQRVIQQASAAINCCYDVLHGKGSISELQAERLLLIACEKRLALLAEIQKMKTDKKEAKEGIQSCFGSLCFQNLQLPLRTEYMFSMSKKEGGETPTHYYFILVRNEASKIVATHLASTHDSLSADALLFKDKFQFDDLESDFEISIEVYSVNHRCKASDVPNQDKTKRTISGLIQKNKVIKKRLEFAIEKTRAKVRKVGGRASCNPARTQGNDESLTPRKLKTRSIHGSIPESPGGPNAIRISNFTMIGSTTIRLEDIENNKFALQKVPFLSPISGHLGCNITVDFQSNAEQHGFLTMFDDVGGLGAWHRRWCALRDGVLYSWTYPDDEKNKEALSSLKLRECISRDVHTVERIMCARPNTFELRTMRPRRHGDKQNLISQDTGSVITTRHWLAADTKEERISWIESMNQALSDVRAWDSSALHPLS